MFIYDTIHKCLLKISLNSLNFVFNDETKNKSPMRE